MKRIFVFFLILALLTGFCWYAKKHPTVNVDNIQMENCNSKNLQTHSLNVFVNFLEKLDYSQNEITNIAIIPATPCSLGLYQVDYQKKQ